MGKRDEGLERRKISLAYGLDMFQFLCCFLYHKTTFIPQNYFLSRGKLLFPTRKHARQVWEKMYFLSISFNNTYSFIFSLSERITSNQGYLLKTCHIVYSLFFHSTSFSFIIHYLKIIHFRMFF